MNDSTVPGCLDNFGNPTFSNGLCNQCEWQETCEKATKMRRELKQLQGEKTE